MDVPEIIETTIMGYAAIKAAKPLSNLGVIGISYFSEIVLWPLVGSFENKEEFYSHVHLFEKKGYDRSVSELLLVENEENLREAIRTERNQWYQEAVDSAREASTSLVFALSYEYFLKTGHLEEIINYLF